MKRWIRCRGTVSGCVQVAVILTMLAPTYYNSASAQSTRAEQSPLPQSLPPERKRRLQAISQTISNEVPLVIAHRGASGYLPEHTTESAALAHALGADFIEQDVVLSQDGIAVVFHGRHSGKKSRMSLNCFRNAGGITDSMYSILRLPS